MPSLPNCFQPLVAVVLAQKVELIIGSAAIQPMFQFQSVALAAVMPFWYTYTGKRVAVIAY